MSQSDDSADAHRVTNAQEERDITTAILPRWLVISLCVFGLLCLIVVLGLCLFWPKAQSWCHSSASRFMALVALSIFAGLFFFILYPQKTQMKPWADRSIRFVGPFALVATIFLFFNWIAPKPVEWVYYPVGVVTSVGDAMPIQHLDIGCAIRRDSRFEVLQVGERMNDRDVRVVGFVVQFRPGVGAVEAWLSPSLHHKAVRLRFDRAAPGKAVDITMHRRSNGKYHLKE